MSRPVEVSNRVFNGDGAMAFLSLVCQEASNGGLLHSKEATMTKFKILSAIVILSTAIAAPVLAKSNYRIPDDQNFRGAYNQSNAPFYAQPLTNKDRDNIEDFGFSGRDPTRVGGEDPYLHPGG
jgi:hypothetical protein